MDNLVPVYALVVCLFLVITIPASEHEASLCDIWVRPVLPWVQQVVAKDNEQNDAKAC